MYCPKCGTQNDNGNYCRSCGANLTRVAKVLTSPQAHGPLQAKRGGGTAFAIFSSTAVTNESRDVDGYSACAVFGGVTVDLRPAPLAPGETRITVVAIFGGGEVFVPDDVAIRVTGVTVFGGCKARGEDFRGGIFSMTEYRSPGYDQAVRRLHIDATCVFGGIEIKK